MVRSEGVVYPVRDDDEKALLLRIIL